MNNTFCLKQMSKAVKLDSNLLLGQYKLDLMVRFVEIKSTNLKLKQDQITKVLFMSNPNLQRYTQDINWLSPYKIPPNSHKRNQKISYREHDLERPQMTSKESAPVIETLKPNTSKRNKLKGGGIIEINDENSDEILQKNNR